LWNINYITFYRKNMKNTSIFEQLKIDKVYSPAKFIFSLLFWSFLVAIAVMIIMPTSIANVKALLLTISEHYKSYFYTVIVILILLGIISRKVIKTLYNNEKYVIEQLIKNLQSCKDEDGGKLKETMKALARIGSPAVRFLTDILDDEKDSIRWASIVTLEIIGDHRAIKPLSKKLQDKNEENRKASTRAIGTITSLNSDKALIKNLSNIYLRLKGKQFADIDKIDKTIEKHYKEKITADELRRNPKSAADAVASLTDMGYKPKGKEEIIDFLAASKKWSELIEIGIPAVRVFKEYSEGKEDALLYAIKDTDKKNRKNATRMLSVIATEGAVKTLIKVLCDEDKDVRKIAAYALGEIGEKNKDIVSSAVEPLIKSMQDEEWEVRRSVAKALGRIRDPKAIKAFISALNDEDWQVRRRAVIELGNMWAEQSLEQLINRLKDSKVEVADYALKSIIKIVEKVDVKNIRVTDKLRSMITDSQVSAHIKERAVDVLIAIGEDAVTELIQVINENIETSIKEKAIYALGKIKSSRATPPLINFFDKESENDYTKRAAADALFKIGARSIIFSLIDVLMTKTKSKSAKQYAALTLGKFKDSVAVYALEKTLDDKNNEGIVRGHAVEALGEINKDLTPVIKALIDENAKVRMAAAYALNYKPEWRESDAAKEVIPLFEKALENKNWDIRYAAASWIVYIKSWILVNQSEDIKIKYFIAFQDWYNLKKTGKPALKMLDKALCECTDEEIKGNIKEVINEINNKNNI
jgi:HEAT repeat protein